VGFLGIMALRAGRIGEPSETKLQSETCMETKKVVIQKPREDDLKERCG
jgi:hypothetical protein